MVRALTENRRDELIRQLKQCWSTDSDISFLNDVSPEVLAGIITETRRSQEQALRALDSVFEIMARSARYIPNFILATMTSSLSPSVLARITELLEPKAAASLSRSYPRPVLAEIWQLLDLRALERLAREMDLETLTSVLDALSQRLYAPAR